MNARHRPRGLILGDAGLLRLAGEFAEFVHRLGGKGAQVAAVLLVIFAGAEREEGSRDVAGEGIQADAALSPAGSELAIVTTDGIRFWLPRPGHYAATAIQREL